MCTFLGADAAASVAAALAAAQPLRQRTGALRAGAPCAVRPRQSLINHTATACAPRRAVDNHNHNQQPLLGNQTHNHAAAGLVKTP